MNFTVAFGSMYQPSTQQLLDLANGRWIEILVAAGIPSERLDGRGHPCPRCGGRDRFSAFPGVEERGAVHCRHCFTGGCDPSPGNGIATLMWMSGTSFLDAKDWLARFLGVDAQQGTHQRTASGHPTGGSFVSAAGTSQRAPRPKPSASHIDRMTRLTKDAMQRITNQQVSDLAGQLGVSDSSLRSLCVGYSSDQSASTWPMRNSDGQIVGIRLRADGQSKKWSVTGSRSGLFLSRDHRPTGDRVFIVEGASDMAAALDLGLSCVGRPDCSSGSLEICTYLIRTGFEQATVIADRDDAGLRGAMRLATNLAIRGIASQVVSVPSNVNDLRDWFANGATRSMVESHPFAEKFSARLVRAQLTFPFAA